MVDSFKGLNVWREIIRVARLMPRDRQLIGKSCCLVLRDQMIEVRSPMSEIRKDNGSWTKGFVKWKLSQTGLKLKQKCLTTDPIFFSEREYRSKITILF
ncbi:hypothetical protein [Desulfosporosinus burensis]